MTAEQPPTIDQSAPIRVGLVGAGPWAKFFHAPMIAGSPEMKLVGVWGLLLEKPLALDLGRARELTDIVNEAGAPSQMVLTWRYADSVRQFIDSCNEIEPLGGRGHFLAGGLLGGVFATPWRVETGPLFDLGPHVLDLLDAALGPIMEVSARGDLHKWIGIQLVHETGVVSEASITAYSHLDPARAGVEVYTAGGVHEVDTVNLAGDAIKVIASEFAITARSGRPHELDVNRGLQIQKLIARAAQGLD